MSTLETDQVVALLRAAEMPVTRENWIALAWGDQVPKPWSMEDELQLPDELQDESKVENDDNGPVGEDDESDEAEEEEA